jgi:hypothetical protein
MRDDHQREEANCDHRE